MFDSKLTLNRTKQSLRLNKAKSAPLTLLNQNFFNSFKGNTALHIFATNYIQFQKWKKVEIFTVFKYI